MTDDRSLERAARSWLEVGPTEAPEHAVEAALLRIQTTVQERDWRAQLPWRNRLMTMPARLIAAAIAIAVVTIGGAIIFRPGAAPTVGSSPSPSVDGSTFVSRLYGYSIALPSDWVATAATAPWTGGEGPDPADAPYLDRFAPQGASNGARMTIRAQLVPPGMTAAAWIADWEQSRDATAQCFGSTTPWSTTTFAGQPARTFQFRCDDSSLTAGYTEVAFVGAGRGYVVHGTGSMLDAASGSFRLTPAATDSPASSAGPAASARAFDYSALGGRILVAHAGNAIDGSETSSTDYHIDRRRLYWMDPRTMTGETSVELLPGWNGDGTGKVNPAISPDGRSIVFEEANLDYPSLWTTPTDPLGIQLAETSPAGNRCHNVAKCAEIHPAFGPNGVLAYVVILDGQAWIELEGPADGQLRELRSTRGPDDVVPEALSFSPDGKRIAFGRVEWQGDVPMKGTVSVVDIAADRATVLPIELQYPGDPGWIDGGSRLVVTDGPASMAAVPLGGPGRTAELYTVASDGSDLRQITHTSGNAITASVMSDGRVMYFNNYLWIVNADGSDPRPVNIRGQDLSTTERGFALIARWVAP